MQNRISLAFTAIFSLVTLSFYNCTSNEIANSKDVNQDKIYQYYDVSHSEGDAGASVTCTFRFGGSNGTTLVLSSPSNIKLDGAEVKVDSNGMAGAFYKVQIPDQKMYGTHEFSFNNTENKVYTNQFTIDSFSYVNVPKETNRNQVLVIQFNCRDLGASDYIVLNTLNTDSSFSLSSVGNLKMITISEKELMRQKGNELNLEAVLYREENLKNAASEGGELNISQRLKPIKIRLN